MPHVLYLDDDATSLLVLRKILEARGMKVFEAKTPEEAWSTLWLHPEIDIAFLDHNLGEVKGWQWLTEIRTHTLLHELPVVVLTTQADRQDVIRYMGLRVQDFLLKRPNIQKVEANIQRAVAFGWQRRLIDAEKITLSGTVLRDHLELIELQACTRCQKELLQQIQHIREKIGSNAAPILQAMLLECENLVENTSWDNLRLTLRNIRMYALLKTFLDGIDTMPTSICLQPSEPDSVSTGPARKPLPVFPTLRLQEVGLPEDGLTLSQLRPFVGATTEERVDKAVQQSGWRVWMQYIQRSLRPASEQPASRQKVFELFPRLEILLYREASLLAPPANPPVSNLTEALIWLGTEKWECFCHLPVILQKTTPFSLGFYWHGLAVSWLAADLRKRFSAESPFPIFLAGMIHDLGKLLLLEAYPFTYRLVWHLAALEHRPLRDCESQVFGCHHAESIGRWMEILGYAEMAAALLWHEEPEHCPVPQIARDLCILRAADLLMQHQGYSNPEASATPDYESALQLLAPINNGTINQSALREAVEKTDGLLSDIFQAMKSRFA